MMKNSKRILVKLLAREGVEVIVGNFKTASFDLKNRTLKMPEFATDKDVQDLLIGHEIGHALWSGSLTEALENVPQKHWSIFNVLEDIRIEKKIQMEFPGFISIFKSGYQKLQEQDFFSIKGKSIESFNFLDRLNIAAKLRNLIDVDFSKEENEFVKKAFSTETLTDVFELTKEFAKRFEEKSETQNPQNFSGDQEQDSTEQDSTEPEQDQDSTEPEQDQDSTEPEQDSTEPEQDSTEQDSTESEQEQDSEFEEIENSPESENVETDEFTSQTQEAFDKKLDEKNEENFDELRKDVFFQDSLNETIIPVKKVVEFFKVVTKSSGRMAVSDSAEYFKNIRKESQQVLREFERKKSAREYAREKTSKTGVIDVNKMHTYRYNEDIFQKNTIRQSGKGHYLYLLIDMSGSMHGYNFEQCMRQCLVLSDFCRGAGVPFKIVGYSSVSNSKKALQTKNAFFHNKDSYVVQLTELLTSDVNKNDYDLLKEIYTQKLNSVLSDYRYSDLFQKYPEFEKIYNALNFSSSTPTLNSICYAYNHIKKIKKTHGDKLFSLSVLTDGQPDWCERDNWLSRAGQVENNIYLNFGSEQLEFKLSGSQRPNRKIADLVGKLKNLHSKSYIFLNFSKKLFSNVIYDINYSEKNKICSEYSRKNFVFSKDVFGFDSIIAINNNKSRKEILKQEELEKNISKDSSVSQLGRYMASNQDSRRLSKFFASSFANIFS